MMGSMMATGQHGITSDDGELHNSLWASLSEVLADNQIGVQVVAVASLALLLMVVALMMPMLAGLTRGYVHEFTVFW